MAYTPEKPPLAESSEQLRARIPGWGADLDPADRPSVPKLQYDPELNGAHWHFPERQEEKWPRERSIEHRFVTPVFGTSCPPKGVSGAIRRLAYQRYSEARAAHWLLLIAADRVDAVGAHVGSFFTTRPDNPITETGVLSEGRRHGVSSRLGQNRADVAHQWLDPVLVGGPWLVAGGVTVLGARALVRRLLLGHRRQSCDPRAISLRCLAACLDVGVKLYRPEGRRCSMLIGELGRQTGVSTRTLRYYESLGLLAAGRTSNGYRDYDDEDLAVVREIRSLVELGFTLEETRPFLECLRAGNAVAGSCPDSLAVYQQKLDEVDAYLARLTRIRSELQSAMQTASHLRALPPEPPRCAFSTTDTQHRKIEESA